METIDFSACDSYPCLNQGTCRNQHTVHFTPVAVESVPVILVAPVSEHAFTCECGSEYNGQYCENRINQCDSEPCLNGAVCNDLVGDYACQCLLGFTGKQCQINIDDCSRSPCRNGGICADLINGYRCECLVGYSGDNCQDGPCALNPCMNGAPCIESGSEFTCQCPFGYWGTRCEFRSIGFSSGAFMEFASLDQDENSVIIEFSTTLPYSLLVYNHDGTTNKNGHFFLLELKDGKAHFSFNLGAGQVSLTTERRVDDGNWHRIQAIRKAQVSHLLCSFYN
ncbi:Protocadherin Fat 4 [Holothuria leucospilota]|uniref:Protocadherin Fat 4 n=1 Tax=Holothuria leucospilota TaxID=206669 RepID=A0A9Q1GZS7_HOLLE|nr:Protocadherin Fat 4 [Holothuria leucospilota]